MASINLRIGPERTVRRPRNQEACELFMEFLMENDIFSNKIQERGHWVLWKFEQKLMEAGFPDDKIDTYIANAFDWMTNRIKGVETDDR